MKIYLSGLSTGKWLADFTVAHKSETNKSIYILESFYTVTKWMPPYIKNEWNFMLDSGAFTFMNDKKNANKINWEKYVDEYADFINTYGVELFLELDIDSIVGIKEVEKYRKLLEEKTKKKCIPVWHKTRGWEYWEIMINKYEYVAIGGIVTKEIKIKDRDATFIRLMNAARNKNKKVHALGYTDTKQLKKYGFYSVDSTSWLWGNKSGMVHVFDGRNIQKIKKPDGKRCKTNELFENNLKQWLLYQNYAEDYL